MQDFTRRALIISGAATAAGSVIGTAEAATGSVALRIASAGFIVGASGGGGTLVFRGHRYPLSIGGISAGAIIGVASADLVGTASNMHAPTDIEGVYSAVGAGLAVAGGRKVATLSNPNGVVLRLRGRQVGFMFSVDLSGMAISLK